MPEAATHRSWQVQEAKQRFSEVLRAVEKEGPQTITKHGEEVAVVVDIVEYRRLTGEKKSFVDHLLSFPTMDPPADGGPDVWDEIEAERKTQFARDIDLGDDE
ncbi:MAG: type II toxin-antitoxin system Phd/YefM family antitoxin [Pseudonocardia sp.]|nr:type II toxin-antitoxin system Phd/YefM family antitoxin [Actinomycetes bacterium]MDN5931541.1 type II toxin-antitoxin system Phd/YefM family antitoxin [Pseudonocardia sp.]